MALSFAGNTRAFVARSERCSAPRVNRYATCNISTSKGKLLVKAAAYNKEDSTKDTNAASVIATSALAASLVCLSSVMPPAASASFAPAADLATAGKEETKRLVESSGTPGAVRPDTMKTNIPFQAPGINAPPRGAAQEQGTNLNRTLKNAGKQIKVNSKDPDAAPFGVGKGPLVREGEKAGQPGRLGRFGNQASEEFKKQSSSTTAANEIDTGKPVDRGYYTVYDKISGKK